MNASLLILTLALGADEAERPAVRQSGLAGLISSTTSASQRSARQTDRERTRRARREFANRPRTGEERLHGGGADASQLIELIQTTVAPDCWQAPVGGGGFGGFGNPPGGGGTTQRDQLIDLIQETVKPESWDIHGGPGSIGVFGP